MLSDLITDQHRAVLVITLSQCSRANQCEYQVGGLSHIKMGIDMNLSGCILEHDVYGIQMYPKGKGQNSTTLIRNCTTVVQFAYIYIDQIILFSRNLLTQ